MKNHKIEFLFYIKKCDTPKYKQIYQNVKQDIMQNVIKSGDILPSIREGSKKLGVSRSSLVRAYLQLVTEGYIESIEKVGYQVIKLSDKIEEKTSLEYELNFKEENIIYTNDGIDNKSFSRSLWKQYYSKIILNPLVDITSLGDEQGEYELRLAISNFIRKHRGVMASPEQIFISSGVQNLISMLANIVGNDYKTICLEEPGYKKVRFTFEDLKYKIFDINVLNNGIDILKVQKNSIIYTSPSYQYPLGNVMTIDRRLEIINFANREKCLIIEDDYASIIRYDGMPIQSLQGLDKYDNTVYISSFSKTFLPCLRISFMVIPKKYTENYYKIKSKYTHTPSKIEQLALAEFIKDGQMEKHLKKINKLYKHKNQIILSYIKQKYKSRLFVKNSDSGFHMVFYCTTNNLDLQLFEDEFLLINVISYKKNELLFSFSYSGICEEDLLYTIDKIVEILKI